MGLKAKANCSVWFLGPEVCPLGMQRTQTGGVHEAGHGTWHEAGEVVIFSSLHAALSISKCPVLLPSSAAPRASALHPSQIPHEPSSHLIAGVGH